MYRTRTICNVAASCCPRLWSSRSPCGTRPSQNARYLWLTRSSAAQKNNKIFSLSTTNDRSIDNDDGCLRPATIQSKEKFIECSIDLVNLIYLRINLNAPFKETDTHCSCCLSLLVHWLSTDCAPLPGIRLRGKWSLILHHGCCCVSSVVQWPWWRAEKTI